MKLNLLLMPKATLPSDRLYYAKLKKKSRNFTVRMDLKKWCDLHHEHFDWEGKGNTSQVHRIKHLNAVLIALRRARLELASYNSPSQIFAYIDLQSSADDALYIHTPNPNGTEFPNPIETVADLAIAPPILARRLDLTLYEVRRYQEPNSSIYYIVPRITGQPAQVTDADKAATSVS